MKVFINKMIIWIFGDKAAQFDKEYAQIKQGLESHNEIDIADRFAYIKSHLNGKKIPMEYSSHPDDSVDVTGHSNDINE